MATVVATPRGATPRTARSTSSSIPFLPGYQGAQAKDRHHISQSLTYMSGGPADSMKMSGEGPTCHGVPMPKIDLSLIKTMADPNHRYNKSARSLTHQEREDMRESARNTYRPAIPPAWLKHDRQVLRFYAYFQEPVHESPKENFRIRHCNIHYYLEDGTMMVTEPKVENSGIPQGTYIKRHRVPKVGGGYYDHTDLRNNSTIMIYSRAFRIVDCDDFTKSFFGDVLGDHPGEAEETPLDSFRMAQLPVHDTSRAAMARTREIAETREYNEISVGGNRKNTKLQQYLENDRRVLCFKAFWDDGTRYGARLYYTLHYFLADDTVEMLENLARNSGRQRFPVFWRRSPLRRNPHIAAAPGVPEPEPVIYKPEDFAVGGSVTVYNRDIVLYDCDEFTREFYQKYLGINQGYMEIKNPQPQHVQLNHPPHVGFGSAEDALASCLHLTPRPPPRDLNKLMDESGLMLRFEGRMVTEKEEDLTRRFIIGVHPADDTISIWEPRQRNSGHGEGKFALKQRKKNPATGTWFHLRDFLVGTVVEIGSIPFMLTDADEATFKYLEEHQDQYPYADARYVAQRLVQRLRPVLEKQDACALEELRFLAEEQLGAGVVTDHELITLGRAFASEENPGAISVPRLLAAAR